jgi:hypothetical protein
MFKNLLTIFGLFAVVAVVLLVVGTTASAQTTTSKTVSGTVMAVQGGSLIVKMDSGDVQVFTPPADRRFTVDGQDLTLAELKPGTHLTATVTETSTPVTDRTVETLQGTVWYVSPPVVILTLANGENHKYIVKHDDPVKFYDREGGERTISDLRKKMVVKATKITEAERVDIAKDTVVTGTGPKVAAAPAPAAEPAAATPAAPAAEPAPTPKMPKTGSALPLVGQLGFLSLIIALGIRRFIQ